MGGSYAKLSRMTMRVMSAASRALGMRTLAAQKDSGDQAQPHPENLFIKIRADQKSREQADDDPLLFG